MRHRKSGGSCPIGDPALGKHPQAIAVGVAAQLLNNQHKSETEITA
jgi:xanthine dehydrogenase accessory factor